jgi:serine/threonine protein kinase
LRIISLSLVEFRRAHPLRRRRDDRADDGGHSASGGFTPGAIIAGRYRLVALLGRGGMGEVYRADDLALDQPVTLKFLPGAAHDDNRLTQPQRAARRAKCRTERLPPGN